VGRADEEPTAPVHRPSLDEQLARQEAAVPEPLLPDEPLLETDPGKPYLVFSLAGADYAVDLANVREIGPPPGVTPLPHVPDWLLGVSNVRGDIVSIVDLRLFLGLPGNGARDPVAGHYRRPRVLVVHSARDDLTTGLLVDGARSICRLTDDRITDVTAPVEQPVAPYLLGQADHAARPLRVLDLERLLQSPEMRPFEPI
jgi:purine-binding chemotaxis protein CheW